MLGAGGVGAAVPPPPLGAGGKWLRTLRAALTSAMVLSETFVPTRLWSGLRVRWMKRVDGYGMEEDVGN